MVSETQRALGGRQVPKVPAHGVCIKDMLPGAQGHRVQQGTKRGASRIGSGRGHLPKATRWVSVCLSLEKHPTDLWSDMIIHLHLPGLLLESAMHLVLPSAPAWKHSRVWLLLPRCHCLMGHSSDTGLKIA